MEPMACNRIWLLPRPFSKATKTSSKGKNEKTQTLAKHRSWCQSILLTLPIKCKSRLVRYSPMHIMTALRKLRMLSLRESAGNKFFCTKTSHSWRCWWIRKELSLPSPTIVLSKKNTNKKSLKNPRFSGKWLTIISHITLTYRLNPVNMGRDSLSSFTLASRAARLSKADGLPALGVPTRQSPVHCVQSAVISAGKVPGGSSSHILITKLDATFQGSSKLFRFFWVFIGFQCQVSPRFCPEWTFTKVLSNEENRPTISHVGRLVPVSTLEPPRLTKSARRIHENQQKPLAIRWLKETWKVYCTLL